jgi:hypothetical protein
MDGSVFAAQSGFLNPFSASSHQKAGASAIQLTRLNASAPAISHQANALIAPNHIRSHTTFIQNCSL